MFSTGSQATGVWYLGAKFRGSTLLLLARARVSIRECTKLWKMVSLSSSAPCLTFASPATAKLEETLTPGRLFRESLS